MVASRACLTTIAFICTLQGAAGAAKLTTLYSFTGSTDGEGPVGSLRDVRGMVYGTTWWGGASHCGTAFRINPATGSLSTVHSFAGNPDGCHSWAALVKVGDLLYGTSEAGGTAGYGTVFEVNPRRSTESGVYSFTGGADGGWPQAALLDVGGILYGTTAGNGSANGVFKFNPATGATSTVYTFGGEPDGESPYGALIKVGAMLYGTTVRGGAVNFGTAFRLNPATGVESVIHSFGVGTDGASPVAAPFKVGGVLYGTTVQGGTAGYGTVFRINLSTGAESVIYSFSGGVDGGYPWSSLINVSGMLYGTTQGGGNGIGYDGNGTIFQIDPTTGKESVVHTFSGTDGGSPIAELINVEGKLYGTTVVGGTYGNGTIFKLQP